VTVIRASGVRPQLGSIGVALLLVVWQGVARTTGAAPVPGLSHPATLADAYHAILNAEFDQVAAQLDGACSDVPEWCAVLDAVSLWWQIALDPESTQYDSRFSRAGENAIAVSTAWTEREPQRAEAWFALGAAYGVRAQWRVQRRERLAAARDGKHIKESLERALALDPDMHDAKFGIGMYRYYAATAPTAFRMLRWLLDLPGGDRKGGLQQMLDARERGFVLRGEADYQLHLIYLWYENRPHDALALIRDLQTRYPDNPVFTLSEANIHDVYFHDHKTSEIVLRALIARATSSEVNASALALRRARAQLNALHTRAKR
jgi:hypothetical protein